jgi:hypothetical protein
MDSATFLAIVTVLVSVILIAIGLYLIVIIHEAYKSLKRLNKILTKVDHLSSFIEQSFARPASGLINLANLIQEGVTFFSDVKKAVHRKETSYHEPPQS